MAVLIEIRGDQQREFRLANRNVLGRASTATIQLNDPLVSREHAEIRKTDDGNYELVDLDSSHGTFVDARRVSLHPLEDGDELIVGATRLRFHREFASVGGRRWSERVPCDLEVTATLPSGDRVETRAVDMSVGGMRLLLDAPLELDSELTLAIGFPNRWRRVRTRARVTRRGSADDGVGVAFVFGSDRDQLILAQEFALLLRTTGDE
jgi:pSer/pThr/pTyr-binding forkhead associated (FHA) protein